MAITSLKSIFSNLLSRGTHPAKSGPGTENAKSFTEKQKAEAAVDRRDIGLGEVPLGKIVGSVGRYQDFNGQFRLKKDHESKKFKQVKEAMKMNNVLEQTNWKVSVKNGAAEILGLNRSTLRARIRKLGIRQP